MRWIPHEYSKYLLRRRSKLEFFHRISYNLERCAYVHLYYRVYYTTLVPFQTNWGMYSSWLHLSSKYFQQKILVTWVMMARWKKTTSQHGNPQTKWAQLMSDLNVCHGIILSWAFHEKWVMFKQLKKKAIFSGWDSFLKQVFQGNIRLNKKGIRQDTKIWKPSKHFCQSKPTTLIKQPANMCQPTLSCENSWAFPKSARILHTSCLAQSLDSSAHQMSWLLTQSSSSSLISYTSLP